MQLATIEQTVAELPGIALADIGPASLLDRMDSKFFLPVDSVPDLLRRVNGYAVLEVAGRRLARYRTQYYDTTALALYHAHHSGQLPRNKVRVRSYQDSGDRFLEVKRRTNRGRTEKVRVPIQQGAFDLSGGLASIAEAGLDAGIPAGELKEALSVDFTRVTLIGRGAPERVTVDLSLRFSRGRAHRALPGIAVVEVKQQEPGPSAFVDALRELGFREGGLSKYCLGIAILEPSAKRNRFKPVLRRLESIGGSRVALDT
jgi:hypothetical protein